MKLEPEDRPQTMEAWLKQLGKPGIPLTWLPWQQTWGAIALEIFGVLAIFAALISGVKDGKDLFFPEKPPTAPVRTTGGFGVPTKWGWGETPASDWLAFA